MDYIFLLEIYSKKCYCTGLYVSLIYFLNLLFKFFFFRNVSRLHILFNGFKFQLFNRLSIYQNIAKQAGLSQYLNSYLKDANGLISNRTKTNSEMLEIQIDEWWNKIWRLFGTIRFDISSGRFIAGNHTLPTAFSVTFENFQCKYLFFFS